jgi:hypothetical protein
MNEVDIAILDLNLLENIVELKINDFVECPAYRKFVLSILLLRC